MMFQKLVLILLAFALIAAAGTIPGGHYRMTLAETAAVQSAVLKAGDYNLTLKDTKLTIVREDNNGVRVEVIVKLETADKKFDGTSVQLNVTGGKAVISEIRLGGTKTKLVLE
jgi:hypothetical protein